MRSRLLLPHQDIHSDIPGPSPTSMIIRFATSRATSRSRASSPDIYQNLHETTPINGSRGGKFPAVPEMMANSGAQNAYTFHFRRWRTQPYDALAIRAAKPSCHFSNAILRSCRDDSRYIIFWVLLVIIAAEKELFFSPSFHNHISR